MTSGAVDESSDLLPKLGVKTRRFSRFFQRILWPFALHELHIFQFPGMEEVIRDPDQVHHLLEQMPAWRHLVSSRPCSRNIPRRRSMSYLSKI